MILLYDSESKFAKEIVKQSDDLNSYKILNDGQHALIHRTNINYEYYLKEHNRDDLHATDAKSYVWIHKTSFVVNNVFHALHSFHVLFRGNNMDNQGNCELTKSLPCIPPSRCNLNIETFGVKMIENIIVYEILHNDPHEADLNNECKCSTDDHKSHDWREFFLLFRFGSFSMGLNG